MDGKYLWEITHGKGKKGGQEKGSEKEGRGEGQNQKGQNEGQEGRQKGRQKDREKSGQEDGSQKPAKKPVKKAAPKKAVVAKAPVVKPAPKETIPVLELEQYKVKPLIEAGVKDAYFGSTRYAWIGSGQAGGRLVKSFFDLGYKKALAVNTTTHDLDLLELPKAQKYLMDIGEKGAGKEMGAAAKRSCEPSRTSCTWRSRPSGPRWIM